MATRLAVSEIEELQKLRSEGRSFKEIARLTGRSPGTVHLYARDIVLPDEVQAGLNRRAAAILNSKPIDERRVWMRAGGRAASRIQARLGHPNLKNGKEVAGLTYRKDELPIKAALEQLLGRTFSKEKVGGVFFDFADSEMLIECSADGTHGVQDLTMRFQVAESKGDQRKRMAFIDTSKVGPLRLARLEALNVGVRDMNDLGV